MDHYQYQTIYNIGLLDDLHNYFPEILYNHGRFQNVPQLLGYIQTQIQTSVNPFNRGAQEYRYAVTTRNLDDMFQTPPRPTTQQPPVAPAAPGRARPQRRITPEHIAPLAPATNLITETFDLTPLLNMTTIPPLINTGFRTQAQDLGILGNLLNILEGMPRTAGIPPDAFAPVVVRPTVEEIDIACTLRAATSRDENNACAVCQESYTEGQAVRTINHCSHSFHRNCIDPWFERNVHCPVCRYDIREASNSNEE